MRIKKQAKGILIDLFFTLLTILVLNSCNRSSKKEKKADTETKIHTSSKLPVEPMEASLPSYIVEGKKVYTQNCLVCHQSNGEGVPGLNPPLNDTPYVLGDKSKLLHIMFKGSNVGLVVKGSTYSNAMPAFNALNDTAISNVTSYIRNSFGNSAEPITANEVAAFRSNITE
jgi:mono/diheme cytochrome c family protein